MGGNALKNTVTRRYSADEYFKLIPDVLNRVMKIDVLLSASVIESYRNKESFGDMDVLYTTFSDSPLAVNDVKSVFSSNEISRNTSVISLDHKELQIDLIHVLQSESEYAASYFAQNDLGNLIGKLAHKFGLKHGHRGLYLPVRNEHHVFGEILLTLDHDKTLEFLGLDVATYKERFDDLINIFDFVASSEHYNPEFYKLEHLNAIARVRDKKRSTYREFLKYGENYKGPVSDMSSDKRVYLEKIFSFFPDALPSYVALLQKVEFKRITAGKFNGNIVSSVTGLSGKELGEFMASIKTQWVFQDHQVVAQSEEEIASNIMAAFTKFK